MVVGYLLRCLSKIWIRVYGGRYCCAMQLSEVLGVAFLFVAAGRRDVTMLRLIPWSLGCLWSFASGFNEFLFYDAAR